MVSLCNDAMSLCSGYELLKKAVCKFFMKKDVYISFRLSRSPIFTNRATFFFDNELCREIPPIVKNLSNENTTLAVRTFL